MSFLEYLEQNPSSILRILPKIFFPSTGILNTIKFPIASSLLDRIKKDGAKLKGIKRCRVYLLSFDSNITRDNLALLLFDFIYTLEIHLYSRKFKSVPTIINSGIICLGNSKAIALEFDRPIAINKCIFSHGSLKPNLVETGQVMEKIISSFLKNRQNDALTFLSLLKTDKNASRKRISIADICNKNLYKAFFTFYSDLEVNKIVKHSSKYFRSIKEYTLFIVRNKKIKTLPQSTFVNFLKKEISKLLVSMLKPKDIETVDSPLVYPFTYIDSMLCSEKHSLEVELNKVFLKDNTYVEKSKYLTFFTPSYRYVKTDKFNYTEEKHIDFCISNYEWLLNYSWYYGLSEAQATDLKGIKSLVGGYLQQLQEPNISDLDKKEAQDRLKILANAFKYDVLVPVREQRSKLFTLVELNHFLDCRNKALTDFNIDLEWKGEELAPYSYIIELANLPGREDLTVDDLVYSGLVGSDEGDIIYFYYFQLMSKLCTLYPNIVVGQKNPLSRALPVSELDLSTAEKGLCSLVHRASSFPLRSTNYVRNFGMWEMLVRAKYQDIFIPGDRQICTKRRGKNNFIR